MGFTCPVTACLRWPRYRTSSKANRFSAPLSLRRGATPGRARLGVAPLLSSNEEALAANSLLFFL